VGLTADVPHEPHRIFLGDAPGSVAAAALAEEDLTDFGFVTNATKLWMHDPDLVEKLFDLIGSTARSAELSFVERGIATITGAGAAGDPYCPLAWGTKVAEVADAGLAASLVSGSDDLLDARGRAIAAWARLVATDPRSATSADLAPLFAAGYDRAQILRLTLFVALRLAFSSVNGALGAVPEQDYVDLAPAEVREAWKARFGA
jgi:alkylhydroperoxidase family enzyme